MRMSAKDLEVFKGVKRKFAWVPVQCSVCGDFSILEWMYAVPMKNAMSVNLFVFGCNFTSVNIAIYCNGCCNSKNEAFDMAIKYDITIKDVILNNQLKYMQRELDSKKETQRQLEHASKKVQIAENINKQIVNDILALPDGDVHPSVHSALVRYTTVEEIDV